ncbi:MAG: hypothetical protein O3A28_09085 [Actinomycetota bacterium]|nr:hypothetical protein [Actinomycetota bacterium]MDA3035165.1 hypothetical protein [Actinomycetota bacterium]
MGQVAYSCTATDRHRLYISARRRSAFAHWRDTHRLDPDNWTYKRQAWSLVGNEAAGGGELGRLMQFGADDSWPFDGDFNRDTAATPPGTYYPKTINV